MVEYSFDIGRGVHSIAPSPNQIIKSKSEYNDQLAINLAKHNKIPISEAKEYMKYE